MPPAILNDSEDEDGEVVFDDGNDGSLSRSSGDQVANITDLDGTRDSAEQSTGSTGTHFTCRELFDTWLMSIAERIQRQMEEVQRSLFADSGEQARSGSGNAVLPNIPAMQPLKRANSTMDNAKPMTSMEKLKIKRQKTSTGVATPEPGLPALQKPGFFARFAQDPKAARTSDPVRYSDHSGAGNSSALPTGSLQADFVNHEPAVMFKGTGSTVAENSSSIDRMAEEARHGKADKSSMIKLVDSDEAHKSSSFPWSASEQTDSAKPERSKDLPAVTGEPETEAAAAMKDANVAQALFQGQESSVGVAASSNTQEQQPFDNKEVPPAEREGMISSPVVQVNVAQEIDQTLNTTSPSTKAPHAPKPEPKAGRGRKRKVQEEASEPLDSDDIGVGLPKERYQPRPSKRRATQATELAIDYSVRPEKAARSKRSKTTTHVEVLPGELSETGEARKSFEKDQKSKGSKTKRPGEMNESSTAKETDVGAAESITEVPSKDSPDKAPNPSPTVQLPAPNSVTVTSPQRPVTRSSQASSQASNDDGVFKKPLPKLKSAKKSMRSKTTIFEDHVDFLGSQRSPTLSQQQAARASALRDVKNEATPAKPRRNTKRVIDDDEDEDEEDELAHEFEQPPPDEDEGPVPEKRGRGRPPKCASKTSGKKSDKSAEKVMDNSDDGEGDEIAVEPPKKRGRGRPPKSTEKKDEPAGDSQANKQASMTQQTGRSPTPPRAFVEPLSPMAKSKPPTPEPTRAETKIPTPSPEKQAPVKEAETPQKPSRQSPTSHSPIKQFSAVPLRVGLSKKYRIPSLLKMVRPPAPKREDPRAAARAKKKKEAEEAQAREEAGEE